MEIDCKGTARIRHSVTHEVYEIDSDELQWDAGGIEERAMGLEIHHEARIEHPALGKLTWGLWEYPIGIENHHVTDAGLHEVVEDFDYGLKSAPDSWVDYAAPADPFANFMDSYHQTGDLLADHGGDGRHLFNRMIFAHQITAMEAYLGDRLIKAVEVDGAAFRRLLELDEDLSREKVTLAEIMTDPSLVQKRVREHLRSIQYHNLAKVDALYNIALNIRILALANDKAKLFNAVILRHDCVHRNGFDKDGIELNIFTKPFVQGTADQIRIFVEAIEKAVRGRSAV